MAEGTLDPSDLGPGTPVPGPGETPGRSLDERSSGIDTNTQIGERDSLRIILRSAAYIRFFFWRYAGKFVLKLSAYVIQLAILPWPAKMLVDHVILGTPVAEAKNYPPYWQPVLDSMVGMSPLEVLFWLALMGLAGVVLIAATSLATGTTSRPASPKATTTRRRRKTRSTAATARSAGCGASWSSS